MNVFGTAHGTPTVFSADKARVSIGGGATNAMATGVSISYSRNVQPINTLGGGTHLSVGTPIGGLTINTLVVKDESVLKLLGVDSECRLANDVKVVMSDGECNSGGGKAFMLSGCIASALSMSVQAGTGFVVMGVTITFTGLKTL